MDSRTELRTESLQIAALAAILLCFFQLLTDFVAGSYAFGLLENRLPPESASAVFLFAPALLLLWPGAFSATGWCLTARVMVACRLVYPLSGTTRMAMLIAGCGTGAALLLLTMLLARAPGRRMTPASVGLALVLAVAASATLRALGDGSDLSTVGSGQLIGLFIAFLALRGSAPESAGSANASSSTAVVAVSCVAVMAGLGLLYAAFIAPNVVASWARVDAVFPACLTLAGGAAAALAFSPGTMRIALSPGSRAALTVVFVSALVAGVATQQVGFPSHPSAYPLRDPGTGLTRLLLLAAGITSPVLYLNVARYVGDLWSERPSVSMVAAGMTLASALLVVFIFANLFVSTYDYVDVVGPLLRDRLWLVVLCAGLIFAAPLLHLSQARFELRGVTPSAVAALSVTAILVVLLFEVAVGPSPSTGGDEALRIVTYNVRQGYNAAGDRDFKGQLQLLRSLRPEVIGLQESETNRMSGGNADLVGYVAKRLGMYSYNGPNPITGTFGLALLSAYPIENARTYYLFSEGEQTAVISASIDVNGRRLNLLVTHLGNGGPMVQQLEVLELAGSQDDTVLMGDFNFRPGSSQYEATRKVLEDAWLLRSNSDGTGTRDHSRRIDHVFVSSGVKVKDVEYIDSSASDHPALLVAVGR